MKELLLEQLKEYQDGVNKNEAICIQMMKDDVDDFILTTQLKKTAGLKMMVEVTVLELAKYV